MSSLFRETSSICVDGRSDIFHHGDHAGTQDNPCASYLSFDVPHQSSRWGLFVRLLVGGCADERTAASGGQWQNHRCHSVSAPSRQTDASIAGTQPLTAHVCFNFGVRSKASTLKRVLTRGLEWTNAFETSVPKFAAVAGIYRTYKRLKRF